MEHERKIQMMQIAPQEQYVGNGVPFRSFSPSFVSSSASDRQPVPFNLPPSIDVDQSLSNVFSLLNLSPATYAGGHLAFDGQIGEGFTHAFGDNARVLNAVSNPRLMHSGNVINHFTVDHSRRHCSSGFDYRLEFDQKSRLGSKPLDFLPCCSSNLNPRYINSFNCEFASTNSQTNQFLSSLCLKQLRGRICFLAKDQNGCRILQAMFETPTMEDVEIVLSEVVDSIADLMKDQIGNYLVQKLVSVCNDDQKMQILLSLTKIPINIILVCMNLHGTRSVQKLLENLKDPNQITLVMRALHHGATLLANDPNGHHVIEYCLVHFHSDIIKPILTEIADECFKIATDRSGCCVLQACVEHSRGEVRNRLVAQIMANSIQLAQDPFGNYVLQHMLGLNIPEFTALLVRQLQGNFAFLSRNKYASNVVEKCLNESGEDVSTRIILELIRSPNSSLLLVDPYANFVIQSALKVSKGFAHECLHGLISKNISSMRSNLYGKKILDKFEKKRIHHS